MRAWTFTEPWATLIVTGEKKWETRSRPNYKVVGERVAIHAAKGFPRYAQELCTENNFFIAALARHEVNHDAFDLGCVIGFAKVNSCLHVEKVEELPHRAGEGFWRLFRWPVLLPSHRPRDD